MLFSNNILFSLISNQPKRLAFIERKPQKTIILDENIVWYIAPKFAALRSNNIANEVPKGITASNNNLKKNKMLLHVKYVTVIMKKIKNN